MKISTPDTKAVRSALVGLATGALVVGGVLYGGTLTGALRGDGLLLSQSARAAFVVQTPSTNLVHAAPRSTGTALAAAPVSVSYRVAELEAADEQPNDRKSEED